MMLWKTHVALVNNFDALMGQKAATSLQVTKETKPYKWCHCCCDSEEL